jgi:hypothetical protein
MKKSISVLLCLLFISMGFAEELKVKGVYQGRNLFVQNSLVDEKTGDFCITKVIVNGEEIPDEVRSSAFVISFDRMDIELGEDITILFTHKENCAPLIINPEVLKPLSTYKLLAHRVEDGFLVFETTQEASRLMFYVEEFRWNRWLQIAEVQGIGGPDDNDYRVKIYPCDGVNKYRIKQIDHLDRISYSDTLQLAFEVDRVKFLNKKRIKDSIEFSGETLYELYNEYGERVKFGGDASIDISDLMPGKYYLSYDDKVVEILRQ